MGFTDSVRARPAAGEAASQLGRDAPCHPYLQRFLLDVASGGTSIPPHRAAPALLAWARLDPAPVLRLLEDGNAIARVSAGIALGRGYRRFAAALLAASRSPNAETRLAAAAGLGEAAVRGSCQAAEALAGMLQEEDGQVRWWAAVHLGRARGARCARRAEGALAQAIRAGDERALTGAVFALARLWPARKRSTVRLLGEARERGLAGRRAVALVARRLPFGAGRGLAKLSSADPDPEVRAFSAIAYAAWASAACGAREEATARRALAALAAESHPLVRAAAAEGLAALPGDGAGLVERLAADRSAAVRAAVAEGLSRATGGGQEALLVALARDRAPQVRAAAASALACKARGAGRAEARGGRRARSGRARPTLAGAAAGNLLRDLARDRHANVRAAAAAGFDGGAEADRELLLSMTEDRDPAVARAAARALGSHITGTNGPAWQRLVALCQETPVREAAAEAAACVLDQNTQSAPAALWRWPAGPDTAGVLARIARTAGTWQVAETARTLSHALDPACDFADAAGDAAAAFAMAGAPFGPAPFDFAQGKQGRPDIAALLQWLADCPSRLEIRESSRGDSASRPYGPADKARLGSRIRKLGPRARLLLLAREAAGRAARARRPADGQAALARARAALAAILERAPEDVGALCLQRAARLWQSAAGSRGDSASRPYGGAAQTGELRATLTSRCVLSGPRATVALLLENLADHPLLEIQAACRGAEPAVAVAFLAPGDSREVELRCPPAAGSGVIEVRGSGRYRAAGQLRDFTFGGAVTALRAGRLAPVANPYVVGKPLVEDDPMFFGRAEEIAAIERAVTASESGSVVVVVGHRRTGKTSLLKRLAGRLAPSCRPAFIDLQGILASNTDAFLRELAQPLLPYAEMLSDGDAAHATTGADMVREAVARSERRIVLLLDEFDDLEQKVRSGLLDGAVLDQLRHLMQHNRNLSLVLSGTHRIEELGGGLWSFLLNLASYRRIGCLSGEEAESVLREPLARLGIACEDAAVTRAVRLTGGHPYFLQALGYRIVESCVASGQAGVWADSVEEAAGQVIEQGGIHLRYLWESAGDGGRAIVKRLAAEEAAITADELRDAVGRGRPSTPLPSTSLRASRAGWHPPGQALQPMLDRLTALDIIAQEGGRYRLRMELLGRWLRRGDGRGQGLGVRG